MNESDFLPSPLRGDHGGGVARSATEGGATSDISDHVRFEEPWQAQAWVLAHALAGKGLFSLAEWSDALGAAVRAHGADDGGAYYDAVLEALEALIVSKGAASPADLAQVKDAWRQAYETTPHGRPVELKHNPF